MITYYIKGRAGLNFGFTLCDVDFRSRRLRRTSIYSRPVVESHMHDSYHSSREEKISNTQISSTKSCLKDTRLGNRKSDKRSRNNNAEQNVTLKYPNDGLCKTSDLQNISNDFDSENALSLDKTKIKMQVMTPHTRRRAQLATVRRSSLSSSIALKKVAPCTPQPPSDPTVVLKKKIKIKMDAQIEYKVAHMPPSTPYALIIDSTKNGSPIETFVKIDERPNRSKAATFVTETPAPLVSKPSSQEKKQMNSYCSSITPKSSHYNAKRHNIKESFRQLASEPSKKCHENNEMQSENEEEKENQEQVTQNQQEQHLLSNQLGQSHIVTGDLMKMCIVM